MDVSAVKIEIKEIIKDSLSVKIYTWDANTTITRNNSNR